MWGSIGKLFDDWQVRWHRRRILSALALNTRGEVRPDGLTLHSVSHRLDIQWRARDVHPWDQDLPPQQKATLFAEQALADTESAISRLFEVLPHVDLINLTVLDPSTETPMLEGTVHRSALNRNRKLLSVKMRLTHLGVNYCLIGSRFTQLQF